MAPINVTVTWSDVYSGGRGCAAAYGLPVVLMVAKSLSKLTAIVAVLPCAISTTVPGMRATPVRNTPEDSFRGSNVVATAAVPIAHAIAATIAYLTRRRP